MNPLVAVVLGTRPEAVKLAPVARALAACPELRVAVWTTGQHRELARAVLAEFNLTATVDLDLMRPGQTLGSVAAGALIGLDSTLETHKPALVLVQGDTTTAFAAALAAFYRQVPVGHVEAGLRTGDVSSPFPEEANRRLITPLTTLHFAATAAAAANLAREGVPPSHIYHVGNPVIDALLQTADRVAANPPDLPGLPANLLTSSQPLVLITGHRRENFGAGLTAVAAAISELAGLFPQAQFIYPVHPNPAAQAAVEAVLRPADWPNVHLVGPLEYPAFIALFQRATVVISDSGGVQEEATALGVPVLVTRETTERPEAVEAGIAELVGTDRTTVVRAASRLILDPAYRATRAIPKPVYGDGTAATQIAKVCAHFLTQPGQA